MRGVAALVVVAVLAGCASLPDGARDGDGGASTTAGPPSEGRRWLERGVALFERGRYADAVRLLQESPEIVADGATVRAEALKLQAFGQCVTGRQAACRRSFDALLVLDPAFVLAPAEAGHPSWGPEFERARAAARAAPDRAR